jgi:hydroxyacyl-ACP dehydratase HTD2-like protein with hotdog domain
MFSASTWNRHLVHYSKDQALLEGHADVVVHRGLLGNYLARLVGEWVQDQGELSTLTWKVVKSTYPKIELLCTGQAIQWENSGHQQLLKCDLKIENSNHEMIVSGEARLRIFSI